MCLRRKNQNLVISNLFLEFLIIFYFLVPLTILSEMILTLDKMYIQRNNGININKIYYIWNYEGFLNKYIYKNYLYKKK